MCPFQGAPSAGTWAAGALRQVKPSMQLAPSAKIRQCCKEGGVKRKGKRKKKGKRNHDFSFFLALFSPPPHSHSQLSFLHLHRSDYPLPPGSNKPLQQVIQIEIVLQCKKRLRKEGRKGEGREKEGRKEGRRKERELLYQNIYSKKEKESLCSWITQCMCLVGDVSFYTTIPLGLWPLQGGK